MSYEDQLIREATGQGRDFEENHDCPKCDQHFSDCVCLEEATPEATMPRIEVTQQGETLQ